MDAVKKYGIMAGLAFAAWQYIKVYTGMHETEFSVLSDFLPLPVFIICIFMSIREHRVQTGGFLEFTDGLKSGLGTTVVAALIASISNYVYSKWINSNWVLHEAEKFRSLLITQGGVASSNIQKEVDIFASHFPFRSSLIVLASMIFMGGIISIVLAATMRKKQPSHSV